MRKTAMVAALLCGIALGCLLATAWFVLNEEPLPKTLAERMAEVLDAVPPDDMSTIGLFSLADGEDRQRTDEFLSAMRRSDPAVKRIRKIVTSGGFAQDVVLRPRVEGLSEMRAAGRLLYMGALAAHYGNDADEVRENLLAAFALVDALAMSPHYLDHLTEGPLHGLANSYAMRIYTERSLTGDDARRLLTALLDPLHSSRLMQSLQALWQDSMQVKSVADWRVRRFFATGFLKDLAPDKEGLSPVQREEKLMKRDLETLSDLREKVMAEIFWPYYALPETEFWREIVNYRDARGGDEYPLSDFARTGIGIIIKNSNKRMAEARLLAVLMRARLFEAATGNLPSDLDGIDGYLADEPWPWGPALEVYAPCIDVFTGEPLKCLVTKDDEGRVTKFTAYSVGPDLVDNGGRSDFQAGQVGEYDIMIDILPAALR